MPDLVLDPDDGRETGLRVPRHTPANFSHLNPPPVSPLRQTFTDALDRAYLDAYGRTATAAEQAVAAGLTVEQVDFATDMEQVGENWQVKVTATLRVNHSSC